MVITSDAARSAASGRWHEFAVQAGDAVRWRRRANGLPLRRLKPL